MSTENKPWEKVLGPGMPMGIISVTPDSNVEIRVTPQTQSPRPQTENTSPYRKVLSWIWFLVKIGIGLAIAAGLIWLGFYIYGHRQSWFAVTNNPEPKAAPAKTETEIEIDKVSLENTKLNFDLKKAATNPTTPKEEKYFVERKGNVDSKNRIHAYIWPEHLPFPDLKYEIVTAEGGNVWCVAKIRRHPVQYRAGVVDGNHEIALLASVEDGLTYKSDNGKSFELSLTAEKEKSGPHMWVHNASRYGLDFYGDPKSDTIYEIWYDAPMFDDKGNQIGMIPTELPNGWIAVSAYSGEELMKIPEIRREMERNKL